MENTSLKTAIFAGGCFWCTEAIYQDLKGVHAVVSGYTAGHVANPTYKEVCSGTTGHTEGIKITYDPAVITYDQLLDIFFTTHDPTTLNRQGNDVGTQYRSGVYYATEEEKDKAKAAITRAQELYPNPIVTEVEPLEIFYEAEDYHQNYFNEHGNQPYCAFVINPKVSKFRKQYADMLKS
ncbi:MAG: peptide-methionine (S)-S-oxide reductase MsrA [Bacteroidota bacterium]